MDKPPYPEYLENHQFFPLLHAVREQNIMAIIGRCPTDSRVGGAFGTVR